MGKGVITVFGLAMLAMFMLVTLGCSTVQGSFCDVSRPIRPTQAEVSTMSEGTVAEILAHNTKGQKLCGWKPAQS